MKQKGKIWSLRLFAEGFTRLKITGFVGLVLILISQFLSLDGAKLVVLILVPVMMEQLFGFVNRRADSDFYHAVPTRRIAVFLSYGTAVLLWIVIFSALSQIKFILEDARSWDGISYAERLLAHYLQVMGETCALGILLMGAMAVAMSLTGTVFTNIVTAMLILFGPRMIVDLAIQNYYAMVPLVRVSNWVGKFFRPSSQLAYRLFSSLTNGYALLRIGYSTSDFGMSVITNISRSVSSEYGGLPAWFSALYSTALGALYLILGGVLFVKRKSEAAEKTGVGKLARMMIAMGLMLVFTLSGTFLLSRRLIHQSGEGINLISILVLWVLGIGSCLFYQKGSGGKRHVKRMMVWILPAAVLINAVVCLLFVKGTQAALADVPEAAQIEAVTVNLAEGRFFQDTERELLYLIGRKSFSSDEIRQIVSDSLKKEIDIFREGEQAFSDYRSETYLDDFIAITCKQDGKPRQMERRLMLTSEQQNAFEKAMAEELGNVYMDVDLRPHLWMSNLTCSMCGRGLDQPQLEKVYDCLREEIKEKKLPFSIYLGKNYNRENVFDFMEDSLSDTPLPISVSTPKTVELMAKTGNEAAKDGLSLTDFVEHMGEESHKETAKLFFILYDKKSENGLLYGRYEFMSDEDRQRIARLGDMLQAHKEQEITMEKNVLYVRYSYENVGLMEENGRWYNLTDEETARLKELLDSHPYIRSEMVE